MRPCVGIIFGNEEVTATGRTDVHVNVLTREIVTDDARRAGIRLMRTMDDLLEMDIVYIL
jgi:hypothetical protein